MGFVMTHLAIAREINNRLGIIRDLPGYYLGSISPDMVHVRRNYESGMKKKSHFCIGDEPWGSITNNDEWLENILMHLDSYEGHPHYDFILGYFIHIIVDVFDNIKIHMPFKEKYYVKNIPFEDYIKVFYNDKSQNDFALLECCEWAGEVIGILAGARGYGVAGISTALETEAYRDLVFKLYSEGCTYSDPIAFFTLQDNLDFINATAEEICMLLTYSNLTKKT